jgi:hypothetical protein
LAFKLTFKIECECRITKQKFKHGLLKYCDFVLRFPECEISLKLVMETPPPYLGYHFVYNEFNIISVQKNNTYRGFPECKYCKKIIDVKYIEQGDHWCYTYANTKRNKHKKKHRNLVNQIIKCAAVQQAVFKKLYYSPMQSVMYSSYTYQAKHIGNMFLILSKRKEGLVGTLPTDIVKLILKQYYKYINQMFDK